MPDLRSPAARRGLVERAFAEALTAVAPDTAVQRVLQRDERGLVVDGQPIPVEGRLVVVAIGKAAVPMARAVDAILGDRIDTAWLLTKDGHADGAPARFRVFEAAHPVPDARGIAASRAILEGVEGLGADDIVLALISGGGSALFEAPVEGIALDDVQAVTDLLLRAGAPIQDLNAVRSELSEVKGGGFRRHIGTARVVSLILSDVLGNAPEVIASGPTVPRTPDPARARALLERYDLWERVPAPVRSRLERQPSGEGAVVDAERDLFHIVGDNAMLVDAARRSLEAEGLSVDVVWERREGEARDQAIEWVDVLERAGADATLGGGELTVKVRGDGVGGRNTELALAAAIELDRRQLRGTVASLASDGQDGGVDAAGGVVDEKSVAALREAGIDPQAALDANDSGTALGEIGALIAPGPTGTNVNDVYIALRAGD